MFRVGQAVVVICSVRRRWLTEGSVGSDQAAEPPLQRTPVLASKNECEEDCRYGADVLPAIQLGDVGSGGCSDGLKKVRSGDGTRA